jgi:hypothetical protein
MFRVKQNIPTRGHPAHFTPPHLVYKQPLLFIHIFLAIFLDFFSGILFTVERSGAKWIKVE